MRQHDREKAASGSLDQRIAVLGNVCKIRRLAPVVRCPVRLEICRTLGLVNSLHVKGIAALLDLDHSSVSKHLTAMLPSGVIEEQKIGRRTVCRLGEECLFSRENGLLRLGLTTPEGHLIQIEGPDASTETPPWIDSVSSVASELFCSDARCRVFFGVLLNSELCVKEIGELCGISMPLASYHILSLRKIDLLDAREQRSRHIARPTLACHLTGSHGLRSITLAIKGNAKLSMQVQLGEFADPHIEPSPEGRTDTTNGTIPRVPEISTKPRSGKFARDP